MGRGTRMLLIALTIFFGLAGSASATTYYIAANGSDSNSGTSKSSPWLHAPGMKGCSSVCASTTPKPGDTIIFRGGDTWTFSAKWTIPSSGSSGSPITYGGEDTSWYNSSVCGASFCRPIFSGGGTWPGTANGDFVSFGNDSYVVLDNVEFTSAYVSGAGNGNYINLWESSHSTVSNCYFHKLIVDSSPLTGSAGWGVVYGQGIGPGSDELFTLNALDFSDSTTSPNAVGDVDGIFAAGGLEVSKNYFSTTSTAYVGEAHLFHDNTIYDGGVAPSQNGLHPNQMESNGDSGATGGSGSGCGLWYNNVLISPDMGQLGGTPILFQVGPAPGCTSYIFNNVYEDQAPREVINCSNGGAGGTSIGTCLAFNNTMECQRDGSANYGSCSQIGDHSDVGTMELEYNHLILNTGAGSQCLVKGGIGTCTQTPNPNLSQSLSTANGQGYSLSNNFSPQSASAATVGAGFSASSLNSLCSTISAIDAAAGTACQKDTTLGVSYNPINHTVSWPAKTPNVRLLSSGTNDAGAYQYGTSSASDAPNAPSGLTAIVQ